MHCVLQLELAPEPEPHWHGDDGAIVETGMQITAGTIFRFEILLWRSAEVDGILI